MNDRSYIGDLQHQNTDLQRELGNLKKELDLTNQKLGSSMHSIKTFWSPELKKERALRKEESAKYSLINDQLKLLNQENQVNVDKIQYTFWISSEKLFFLANLFTETSNARATVGRRVAFANARTKHWNATTDWSVVRWEWTLDARNCNTTRHNQGR
jgi:hypothetical protein